MTIVGKRWLWGSTGLAAIFRFHALFTNTFHNDEALFASYARLIAVWREPLLQLQPVDKPPLLFYLQALFFPLFGPVEWAARLPNLIASLLLVPLVGVWAWRLYGDEKTAVVSSFLTALIPISIQFSATAFTDPLLIALLTAGFAAASGQPHPLLAAIFFGLAVGTKHQAWLFLPLLIGLGWYGGWHGRHWRRWLFGLFPLVALLLLWEWARTGKIQLWQAQMTNFGGLRLVWSWEIWPRAQAWHVLWAQALGSIGWNWALAVALLWGGIDAWRQRNRHSRPVLLLLLFIAGYGLSHWLLAIPVWDRYLLPLIPLLALVVGRQIALRMPRMGLLVLLLMLPGAWLARDGRFPIGGQVWADQGAAIVAEALADAPYGTVLYDHWYGWQWRYHLFDKRVFVSWFPDSGVLTEQLEAFGNDGHRHYLALPDTIAADPVKQAVVQAGFRLQPVPLAASTQIRLYEIVVTGDW